MRYPVVSERRIQYGHYIVEIKKQSIRYYLKNLQNTIIEQKKNIIKYFLGDL